MENNMKKRTFLIIAIISRYTLLTALTTADIPELLQHVDNRIPVAIIGSGPAGLSAAIQTARSGYQTVVFQGTKPLGELSDAYIVENWPGIAKTNGEEIMRKLEDQVKSFGTHLVSLTVDAVDFSSWPYKLSLSDDTDVFALTVIIATGSTQKKLGIKGEQRYWGKGLFTCGLCDATFTRDKETAVIGDGDIAIQRALQLAPYAKSITLIIPKEQMTAHKSMLEKIKDNPTIKILPNKLVKEIAGTPQEITHIVLFDSKTQTTLNYPVSSVFLSTELTPSTDLFKGKLPFSDDGCLALEKGSRSQKTDIEGVMAAGTVADSTYRQVGAIAGAGTKAGMDAVSFLSQWGFDGPLRSYSSEQLYSPVEITHFPIDDLTTYEDFNTALQTDKPVIIEFYARGCPTCKKMEDPFAHLTKKYADKITVYKGERDALYDLIEKYDMNLMPAFFLFYKGKEIERIEGATTAQKLKSLFKKGIAISQAPQKK